MNVKTQDKKATDEEWQEIEKILKETKLLISQQMHSIDDLLIMLHLHSSYSCMMTRRLISAENYLKEACKKYVHK